MILKNSFAIVLISLINSCSMKGQELLLPGKIAVELSLGRNDTCVIYEGNKEHRFVLKNTELNSFGGLTWLNTEDAFLATQTVKNKERTKNLQTIFVKMDTNGIVLEKIFEVKYPKSIGLTFLSGKDEKLLFLSSTKKENASILENFNPKNSIVIMDFKSKQVVKTLDPVGGLHLEIEESPWLPDENRFVYAITNSKRVMVQGEQLVKMENEAGVYLYDLVNDKGTLIIPGGTHPMSSPLRDEIAFMKNGKIGIYKLEDKSIKWLYNFTKSSVMHWSPDGNYVYILDYNLIGNDSTERLIRVNDGVEVPFKAVHHGYYSFSWK